MPEDTAEGQFHAVVGAVLRGELPSAPLAQVPGLCRWAIRHRLAPYLAWCLRHEPGSPVELRNVRVAASALELASEASIRRLLQALVETGAVPMAFKGLGVAHLYYPSADLRPLGDIDLLFRREHVATAVNALEELGFDWPSRDPAVIEYLLTDEYDVPLQGSGTVVEVHHSLYRECSDSFVEEVRNAALPTQILGVPVLTLRPEHLFLVLSVHFGLSDPGSVWVWLLDLVLIGRTFGSAEWAVVASTARQHGLQLFPTMVLMAIERLWGIRLANAEMMRGLSDGMGPAEKAMLRATTSLRSGRVISGDLVRVTRRISGRPVRGTRGVWGSVLCHPGAVCLDLGVSSRSRWFAMNRARHVAVRLLRLARASLGMRQTDRRN